MFKITTIIYSLFIIAPMYAMTPDQTNHEIPSHFESEFFEINPIDLIRSAKGISLIHKYHNEQQKKVAYAFACALSCDPDSTYTKHNKENFQKQCQYLLLNNRHSTLTATFFNTSSTLSEQAYQELMGTTRLEKNNIKDITAHDLKLLTTYKHWKLHHALLVCYIQKN